MALSIDGLVTKFSKLPNGELEEKYNYIKGKIENGRGTHVSTLSGSLSLTTSFNVLNQAMLRMYEHSPHKYAFMSSGWEALRTGSKEKKWRFTSTTPMIAALHAVDVIREIHSRHRKQKKKGRGGEIQKQIPVGSTSYLDIPQRSAAAIGYVTDLLSLSNLGILPEDTLTEKHQEILASYNDAINFLKSTSSNLVGQYELPHFFFTNENTLETRYDLYHTSYNKFFFNRQKLIDDANIKKLDYSVYEHVEFDALSELVDKQFVDPGLISPKQYCRAQIMALKQKQESSEFWKIKLLEYANIFSFMNRYDLDEDKLSTEEAPSVILWNLGYQNFVPQSEPERKFRKPRGSAETRSVPIIPKESLPVLNDSIENVVIINPWSDDLNQYSLNQYSGHVLMAHQCYQQGYQQNPDRYVLFHGAERLPNNSATTPEKILYNDLMELGITPVNAAEVK